MAAANHIASEISEEEWDSSVHRAGATERGKAEDELQALSEVEDGEEEK
jgi:hypothetical protein